VRNRSLQTVRKHVAALVAVVALLGQAFFPHVHALERRHVASGGDGGSLARCTAACPAVLATATTSAADGATDRHSSSSCPLCRAQSDARSSLLPSSLVVPSSLTGAAMSPADAVVSLTAAVRSLAAPRAPPFAS
jgi:hypothetical protein